MANANIDAFYVGSLKIKISHFFSENFYILNWCVTKVAHCIDTITMNLCILCFKGSKVVTSKF